MNILGQQTETFPLITRKLKKYNTGDFMLQTVKTSLRHTNDKVDISQPIVYSWSPSRGRILLIRRTLTRKIASDV